MLLFFLLSVSSSRRYKCFWDYYKQFDSLYLFSFSSYRVDPTFISAKMDRFGLNEAHILTSVAHNDPVELNRWTQKKNLLIGYWYAIFGILSVVNFFCWQTSYIYPTESHQILINDKSVSPLSLALIHHFDVNTL